MAGDMARRRLGALVRHQRTTLGLSVRAAAKAAGMDRATWTALEDGTRETQDSKFAGIERALQWGPESVYRVLEDGQPQAVEAALADEAEVDDARLRIINATVDELIEMRRVFAVDDIDAADRWFHAALRMRERATKRTAEREHSSDHLGHSGGSNPRTA